MSLKVGVSKLILICTHSAHKTKVTFTTPINTKKHFFATRPNDGQSPRKPRKLVISPSDGDKSESSALSDGIPLGYTTQSGKSESEQIIEPTLTSEKQRKPEMEQDNSTSTDTQKYAFRILNEDILEQSKQNMSALSDEEQRLYKVVQHLINEGFVDELELLKLAEKRKQIVSKATNEFAAFEKDTAMNSNSGKFDEKGLNEWREQTIKEMECDMVNYKILTTPLLINTKEYMFNKKWRDPLDELEQNSFYELQLDDRDLKHILLYLIYNHLNTKRFYELNPSIKELANLLYGIKTQSDFNKLLNTMSRTRKQIMDLMQGYPRQSTPNVLLNYDNVSDLEHSNDSYDYDEYSQNIAQSEREMTSFELDTTIKRIQDLEFRQYGYTQIEAHKYDENDEFVEMVQKEDETETETTENKTEQNEEDSTINVEGEEEHNKRKGYYNSVMEKVSQRWNGDLMDIKHIGGDWRVRLGIGERQHNTELDYSSEVEQECQRQLNESIAYTTRKRYKLSPWKIRSLPYTEATELNIHFMNIKLLNKFVNDRGMILPRRFTGVDKRTQKRISKAIKRARKNGFMPHMSKLLILDKERIHKKRDDLYIKNFLRNEKDEYDLMSVTDVQSMYPEYAYESVDESQGLEMHFDREYDIDASELMYETQLRKQQNIFMKQIKQDIIKKIPEYWQRRLSFRDKSNALVNMKHNKQKRQKQGTDKLLEST